MGRKNLKILLHCDISVYEGKQLSEFGQNLDACFDIKHSAMNNLYFYHVTIHMKVRLNSQVTWLLDVLI